MSSQSVAAHPGSSLRRTARGIQASTAYTEPQR